ncbi:unnamed protein product [Notodromas monacha]|uniref:tRNA-dihydrouridine synthase n=1 Tax=Notodromas monacha TaxID=399045 RepID=A0A7R9BMD4_9CRUS|nr:unnamed protein product [Notodromas monacha]CAG0917262.1 unnamed protein product [Notodromas monacha]
MTCSQCHRESSELVRSPLDILTDPDIIARICAPMVRYSKLPFRLLVRKYGCDIAYSPMIVADPFVRSEKARLAEFATSPDDRPLIVQFGAADAVEFSKATEIIAGVCDGVDLNCGCPQRWVSKKGFGACLLNKPEFVADMVSAVKRLPLPEKFTVSIKIRIKEDLRKTIDFCRAVENAGVDFIAVHGRTTSQRKEPANLEAIATIKESLRIPVIANGGMKNLKDVHEVHSRTGVNGVMIAEGLLENPALFVSECEVTPANCILDYCNFAARYERRFNTFHHHLMSMCQRWHAKPQRKVFNALTNFSDVVSYLHTNHECFSDSDFPLFGDSSDEESACD